VAPPELSRAALVFLVPSMICAVLGRALATGDLATALAAPTAEAPPAEDLTRLDE
jgi:hypothetical protein